MVTKPIADDGDFAAGLLAESDVEASAELSVALAALRSLAERPAPEPSAQLAALFETGSGGSGAVPFDRKKRRRNAAIAGGVLVLAMTTGVSGVAALSSPANRQALFESGVVGPLVQLWDRLDLPHPTTRLPTTDENRPVPQPAGPNGNGAGNGSAGAGSGAAVPVAPDAALPGPRGTAPHGITRENFLPRLNGPIRADRDAPVQPKAGISGVPPAPAAPELPETADDIVPSQATPQPAPSNHPR